jgi:hypothetical protein
MGRPFKHKIWENTGDRTKLREYDCFDCMDSWDMWLTDPIMELCPNCGSNNFTHRQGMNTMHMHADYNDDYQGADIFDQYGRY